LNVEPNQSCDSTHRDLESFPSCSVDVAAAYFVLEHVPAPVAFLSQCARILRPNGLLIIEVPDLELYPKFPTSFILNEHLNHFSPRTLAQVAQLAGFEVLEINRDACSRSYGFAAVLQLRGDIGTTYKRDVSEFRQAEKLLRDTLRVVDIYETDVVSVRQRISETMNGGGKVAVWGANAVALHLLKVPSPAVVMVDSNPEKHGFFPWVDVRLPHEAADQLCECALFIVCTRRHAQVIIRILEGLIGRKVDEQVVILDLPETT
ncbi:MAG: class I SAM-dependent methyltransferase, partial [Humidesulfovibrio sp.]|nr:class I SAM-dependent methyltransferase [Humidesulfovibrio sp.]